MADQHRAADHRGPRACGADRSAGGVDRRHGGPRPPGQDRAHRAVHRSCGRVGRRPGGDPLGPRHAAGGGMNGRDWVSAMLEAMRRRRSIAAEAFRAILAGLTGVHVQVEPINADTEGDRLTDRRRRVT